jgi:glycosyltransferase involved in cell wall biosynthesis
VRDACVQQKISSPDKLVVLGAGSSNGIDAELFDLGEKSSDVATALRHELAIPANAPVIGFIGRFTRDKGIAELFEAFQQVLVERSDCFLMLVGEFEEGDPVPEEIREQLRKHPQVRIVPFVGYAAPYYSVMSVLAFPSHREGMPVVPLEAAAAAVPTVAFIATGNVDAVVHGVTGILVSREDIDAFSQGILRYINDEHTRRNHGQAAKERVLREFRPETVWRLIADEYARELANNGTRKSDSASPRDSTPLPNAHSQQNQRIANNDSRCILHIDRS